MNTQLHLASVGLWGSSLKYILGLLRMAYQVKHKLIRIDRIICHISVDTFRLLSSECEWLEFSELLFGSHISFIVVPGQPSWHSTLWRYSLVKSILDDSCSLGIKFGCVLHFRDLDSLILPREEEVIRSWLDTKTPYLIIKDHPPHDSWPIMAGLFSMNTSMLSKPEMTSFWNVLEKSVPQKELYFSDQIALSSFYRNTEPGSFRIYRGHADTELPLLNHSRGYIGEPINYDLSVDMPGRRIREHYISSRAVS